MLQYTCFLQVNFRFSVGFASIGGVSSAPHLFSKSNPDLDSDDLRTPSGVRCFFEIKQGDATATLDQGDQLLAGEGLLLPTLLGIILIHFGHLQEIVKLVVCNQTSLRFNLFTSISIFSNLKPSFRDEVLASWWSNSSAHSSSATGV